MGLYTLPADNLSKNKTVIKTLGWSGLCTFPANNSSKIKTVIKKKPGVDGSLHPSSRQFI